VKGEGTGIGRERTAVVSAYGKGYKAAKKGKKILNSKTKKTKTGPRGKRVTRTMKGSRRRGGGRGMRRVGKQGRAELTH